MQLPASVQVAEPPAPTTDELDLDPDDPLRAIERQISESASNDRLQAAHGFYAPASGPKPSPDTMSVPSMLASSRLPSAVEQALASKKAAVGMFVGRVVRKKVVQAANESSEVAADSASRSAKSRRAVRALSSESQDTALSSDEDHADEDHEDFQGDENEVEYALQAFSFYCNYTLHLRQVVFLGISHRLASQDRQAIGATAQEAGSGKSQRCTICAAYHRIADLGMIFRQR